VPDLHSGQVLPASLGSARVRELGRADSQDWRAGMNPPVVPFQHAPACSGAGPLEPMEDRFSGPFAVACGWEQGASGACALECVDDPLATRGGAQR